MESKEISTLVKDGLKGLGFNCKGKVCWLELKNIKILFECEFSRWSRSYKIVAGIWFKEMEDIPSKFSANTCHLSHSLTNILMAQGMAQLQIENLLNFDNVVDEKIKGNFLELIAIIKAKVLPYLLQFDDYNFLNENFEDSILLKPFFFYYHDIVYYKQFFNSKAKS